SMVIALDDGRVPPPPVIGVGAEPLGRDVPGVDRGDLDPDVVGDAVGGPVVTRIVRVLDGPRLTLRLCRPLRGRPRLVGDTCRATLHLRREHQPVGDLHGGQRLPLHAVVGPALPALAEGVVKVYRPLPRLVERAVPEGLRVPLGVLVHHVHVVVRGPDLLLRYAATTTREWVGRDDRRPGLHPETVGAGDRALS